MTVHTTLKIGQSDDYDYKSSNAKLPKWLLLHLSTAKSDNSKAITTTERWFKVNVNE